MDYETIILRKDEGIAAIVFNRPERGNAINEQMLDELSLAIDEVNNDEDTRVLVLTGAGRGFCGGGDIGRMGEDSAFSNVKPEKMRQFIIQSAQNVTRKLRAIEIPTIAMVNGFAVGGGFDYACACDIRMGSENSRFASAFVRVGLIPETGGSYFLPRIVGISKALEILFTGRWVEAEEAEKIGLLNRLVPAKDLKNETTELARQLAKAPPISIRMTKQLVNTGLEVCLEETLSKAAAYQAIASASWDHKEGIVAWRENRDPVYRGE